MGLRIVYGVASRTDSRIRPPALTAPSVLSIHVVTIAVVGDCAVWKLNLRSCLGFLGIRL